MLFIASGKVASFVVLIIFIAFTLISLWRFTQNKIPEIRKIAGLDAIDEAIGRAEEMGRPVFFTTFRSSLRSDQAPQTIAGLSCLQYIAKECANKGARLIVLYNIAEAGPLLDGLLKDAYRSVNKLEFYQPDRDLVFQPASSSAIGSMDLFYKENVGSAIMIGRAFYSGVLITEVLRRVGAFVIAGTAYPEMLAFFVGACDYVLIGEEIYAAGAYLSKDDAMLATIGAQDWNKILIIIVLLFSIIAVNIGWSSFLNVFKI